MLPSNIVDSSVNVFLSAYYLFSTAMEAMYFPFALTHLFCSMSSLLNELCTGISGMLLPFDFLILIS